MKRRAVTFLVYLSMGTFAGSAQTGEVQVGIFNPSSNILSVRAKPSVDYRSQNILSNLVVTIRWPNSYKVSLGPVASPVYGVSKQGPQDSSGSYTYQKFGAANNTLVDWVRNKEYELFTVTVEQTGRGVGTFELTNAILGGECYVELNAVDHTNSAKPFFKGSVRSIPLGSPAGPVSRDSSRARAVEKSR